MTGLKEVSTFFELTVSDANVVLCYDYIQMVRSALSQRREERFQRPFTRIHSLCETSRRWLPPPAHPPPPLWQSCYNELKDGEIIALAETALRKSDLKKKKNDDQSEASV